MKLLHGLGVQQMISKVKAGLQATTSFNPASKQKFKKKNKKHMKSHPTPPRNVFLAAVLCNKKTFKKQKTPLGVLGLPIHSHLWYLCGRVPFLKPEKVATHYANLTFEVLDAVGSGRKP